MTDWVSSVGPLKTVVAEMEVYLETLADSLTIKGIGIVPIGSDNAQAWIIHTNA